MSAASGIAAWHGMSCRWHDLAARRLFFYVRLFESGRWRLYFDSRSDFLAHMASVRELERTWARLAGRPAADLDLPP